jgi:hypothetical protein
MSLINDALKKAARQRAEDGADMSLLMPGSQRRSSRQGEPMKTQTVIIIAVGALAVVSAVVTGMMMSSKTEAKEPPKAAAAPTPRVAASPAAKAVAAPQTVAVSLEPRVPTATPIPTSVAVAPPPAAAAAPTIAIAALSPPAQAEAPAASSAASVQNVIDSYHVSGARAAGSESKALIDGHVYRLNDVIDRGLGLRLTKVEEDRLTFTDRAGNSYVKQY